MSGARRKTKKPLAAYTAEEIAKYRQMFVKNTLRRASYRWPWRSMAAKAARVGYGKYRCADCKKIVRNKLKKIDHVNPVVDPREGFVGWDTYIVRLYAGGENFQCLCVVCHKAKTIEENLLRKQTKQAKKGKQV